MKIVGVDNLNREEVADTLWLDNIKPEDSDLAQRVCDRLNRNLGNYSGFFYVLKPDDYRLSRGMADLV
jgi:hypothetical protein